ncbi:MAG: metallophosphoesterase [Planctomycetaceae bacterium]
MTTYRVLQLTDLHVFADNHATLKGIPTHATLKSVVSRILELDGQFDHVVITGDHTHDELPESYRLVRDSLQPWLDRLWQIPGNHDDRSVLRSVFSSRVCGTGADRINFVFSCGDWTCIGLDSHQPGQVPGLLGNDQIQWLKNTIADCASPRLALFIHHPPVRVGSVWMDRIGLQDASELQSLIREQSRIRLVCCGHVHHEFEFTLSEAKIVTTPSTGIQFDPRGDAPTFVADAPGWRIIEFTGMEFSTRVERLPEVQYVPVSDYTGRGER